VPASEVQPPHRGAGHRWLLIGNSRWHWAEAEASGLKTWDQAPAVGVAAARRRPPWAWAAVGAVAAEAGLDAARRLDGSDVPLGDLPPWLGIDRALGGWHAWQEQPGRPVLVADAGTVLSLTRVDGEGCFRGGRLLAGVALQLRAMAAGTTALPDLLSAQPALGAEAAGLHDPFPTATGAAMVAGVVRGLVAAIAAAAGEVERAEGACRLVLTGGDGPLLLPLLQSAISAPLRLSWRPALCLEGLARLRPAGGEAESRGPQARPRSLRI